MKWKKEEEIKATELLKSGLYCFDDIAKILGRTKKSVKEKLRRLGFIESDYYNYNLTEEKTCGQCSESFISLKSENRKYCSKRCATIINNGLRERKPVERNKVYNSRKRSEYHLRKTKGCLNCGCDVYNKYCSPSCQAKYRWSLLVKRIESGDTSLLNNHYKRYLKEKYGEKCMSCGWCEINPSSRKIPIELEHIDGNSENNHITNLKLLCPNCHSLTPTYKSLNAGNGRHSRRKRYKEGKSY